MLKLQGYAKHHDLLCLMCGYSGLHGVINVEMPWYANWVVILVVAAVAAFFVGVLPGLVVGLVWLSVSRDRGSPTLDCTGCGQHITPSNN